MKQARRNWKPLRAFRASASPLPSHFDDSQGRETRARLGAMGYGGDGAKDE
ncbi:MAG: hypothetical protein R3E96_05040 [Planctomycetota bacterium]